MINICFSAGYYMVQQQLLGKV
uniref:Uncharacterized protein n=1 Tax=Rhizophora mucronata TaxID=61149 RepID=A0A2P2PAS3_RHIMU